MIQADDRGFRFLDTGIHSAAWNMALDEAILMQVATGASPPTIRFYAWDRPSVSIGYFQRAQRELDVDRIRARQFGLVRRMTGGRAVLHDHELTYSIMVPESHSVAQASVVESYRFVSNALREGFLTLGLHAEIVSLDNPQERAKFTAPSSAACFDSPSWYELVVDGRKIAGSAQVRAHGGLLQHGALLLDLCVDDLLDILRFKETEQRDIFKQDFVNRAASVKQLSGRDVSYTEAAQAFAKGFSKGLEITLTSGNVTMAEEEIRHRLQDEKYEQDDFTFRR